MLALPGYSNGEFDRTLALLKNGGCTHISAYLLKIEPGTAFYKNPPPDLPDGDAAADYYLYAVKRLEEEGYPQYEISNFARPEHRGRHNLLYWDCRDYLGLGPPPTVAWTACAASGRPDRTQWMPLLPGRWNPGPRASATPRTT